MTSRAAINEELLGLIRRNIPTGVNPADFLIRIIPMSREAAYRRLRGETAFSLEDALKIAHTFGVSLDALSPEPDLDPGYRAMRVTGVGGMADSAESYLKCVLYNVDMVRKLKTLGAPRMTTLTNMLIPFSHILRYETMSRFRLFRWTLKDYNASGGVNMRDMSFPKEIARSEQILLRELVGVSSTFVCSPALLTAYIKDIIYFHSIGRISDDELVSLRQESYALLDGLEADMADVESRSGQQLAFYLSSIHFDTTCFIYRAEGFASAVLQQFGVGYYAVDDQQSLERIVDWQKMIKNNATLISVCGEQMRYEFFRKERALVDLLSL